MRGARCVADTKALMAVRNERATNGHMFDRGQGEEGPCPDLIQGADRAGWTRGDRDVSASSFHTEEIAEPPMTLPPEAILEQLESESVRIPTRKPQKIALAPPATETMFLIHSGVFLLRVKWSDDRHQILSLLYPGDCLRSVVVPAFEKAEIVSGTDAGEVWRMRWPAIVRMITSESQFAREVTDRLAAQAARFALQNVIISGLNGDERVATVMLELALRTGRQTLRGLEFEMPLSRTDIAEHLALNADTVSRILSRMRASGLIAPAGRNRLLCASVEALAGECPIAGLIRSTHEKTRAIPLPV